MENCKILVFTVNWCWEKLGNKPFIITGKGQGTNMINLMFGQANGFYLQWNPMMYNLKLAALLLQDAVCRFWT